MGELLPVSHIIIIIMIVMIIIIIMIGMIIITINPSIYKSGMMPPVEESYWLLPSGPTWLWWLLAILPLDSHAQMHILSQCLLKKRLSAVNHILSLISDPAADVISCL